MLAVLLVAEVRVVRAAFAASPRIAAAPADAEREAGVRFDAGLGASAAVVSEAATPLRAAVAVFVAAALAAAVLAAAADFAELERGGLAGFEVVGVASAVDSRVESVDTGPDSSVGLLFVVADVVRGFAALVFAVLTFAALDFAALDFAAAVRALAERPPACPDRDTRCSDTPMPVPSAASSS